jgi:hypothetical protein
LIASSSRLIRNFVGLPRAYRRGGPEGRQAKLSLLTPRPSPTTKGLARRHPLLAATFAIFLFSLIGLPPDDGVRGLRTRLLTKPASD